MASEGGKEFSGKIALITGGSSGIGAACAAYLRARGAITVVADLNVQDVTGADLSIPVDVTDPEQVDQMVAKTVAEFGRLDIAINNAGIGVPNKKPLAEMSNQDWRQVMAVNIDGIFYSMRAEIPAMLESGGAIVNLASVMGVVSAAESAAYVASKHAVVGITKAAAVDYAKAGIRVNAVGPGFVDTPLLAHQNAETRARTVAAHPMGRLATAEEIAAVVGFLASPAASFVTGSYYLADGGYTTV